LETRRLLAADLEGGLLSDDALDDSELLDQSPAETSDDRYHRSHHDGSRNPVDPLDVSGDDVISALDVLIGINDLNANGARELSQFSAGEGEDSVPHLDVNDDGVISTMDILKVVSALTDPDMLSAGFLSELHAVLVGPNGTRGEAEYEVKREHGQVKRAFEVELEGAAPGSVHDVLVDGVVVDQITVASSGRAFLKFANFSDDVGAVPFPDNFPGVTAGSVVSIGDQASGILSVADYEETHPPDGQTAGSVEMEANAYLHGDSFAYGEAGYEIETEHGVTRQEFKVEVEQAQPGVYEVQVDGVAVGEISVDGRGKGRLKLATHPEGDELPIPADFPDIGTGSVISISNGLTGTMTANNESHDDNADDSSDPSDDGPSGDDSSDDSSDSSDDSSDDASEELDDEEDERDEEAEDDDDDDD